GRLGTERFGCRLRPAAQCVRRGREASSIAVAAVENLVFIDNDRFVQSMLADIGHQVGKVLSLDQGEDVSERVKFAHGHFRSSRLSPTGPSAGLLCLRSFVMLPFPGFQIPPVPSVTATPPRPPTNQHRPVASYLDSRR